MQKNNKNIKHVQINPQALKIAISTVSSQSYGGITYFKHLIPALALNDSKNEYYIYVSRKFSIPKTKKIKNHKYVIIKINCCSFFLRHLWEQIIFPLEIRRRKIDILFTAKNANVFFASCRTVIAIRNMEPFCFNRFTNKNILNAASLLRRILSVFSMMKADRIVAVSKGVYAHLNQYYPKYIDKCSVIYNGNPVSKKLTSRHWCKSSKPFLLTASKFVGYANQLNLIQGYALLKEKRSNLPPLWFAGGIHDKNYYGKVFRLVTEKNLQNSIRFLGLVTHEDLLRFYSQARAFVFPSMLEACPHTLIEAMSFGLPIATSNCPPMPEICGQAAIYFNSEKPSTIATALERILFDANLRKNLTVAARHRCRKFDWAKTAKEYVKLFVNLKEDK